MEGLLGLLMLGGIIAIIVYYTNKRKEEKQNEQVRREETRRIEEAELKEKWDRKTKEFLENGLPIINCSNLQLTQNELCHFMGNACFCRVKQQTVGYEGGSRGVSLRVAKGVSFRVGNYRGHYVKQDITERTDGVIYLTNKKIIFSAIKNSSVIKYEEIINLNVAENMLQIQTEKKTYLFQVVDDFNFMVILDHVINKPEKDVF